MNGYELMAETYRKSKAEQNTTAYDSTIKTLDFLATCSEQDIAELFNSSAFNDITKAYCEVAMKNKGYDAEQIAEVRREIGCLFSEYTVKDILRKTQ